MGLIGETDSRKSRLMKILVGSLDRDAGTVPRQVLIGYCPQADGGRANLQLGGQLSPG